MKTEISELSAAQVLRERFELEKVLGSSRSPLGGMLDAAKSGAVGPGHSGACRDGDEERRLRLLSLLTLCRDLSRQEVDAARLYYFDMQELTPVERNVRLADMREGDGEEIISTRVLGPDGEVLEGWVRVRGQSLRCPSHGEVAAKMADAGQLTADGAPMTAAAVKRRLSDARAKVTTANRWRTFMASQEGAAV